MIFCILFDVTCNGDFTWLLHAEMQRSKDVKMRSGKHLMELFDDAIVIIYC